MSETNRKINWVFFGTSTFSVIVLNEMKAAGYIPSLIVTVEDKPKGRKLVLTSPETKVWAEKEGVKFIQLKTLRKPESEEAIKSFSSDGFDVFVVASYGKIIPQNILDLPKHKTVNVHPSLLPKLRGASPIQSAILTEDETGVTIIELDADVDHGPILAQKKIQLTDWPAYTEDAEKKLGVESGKLLAEIFPDIVTETIKKVEQDHSLATFCQKIEKTDGEIDLNGDPMQNLRKIRAYHIWPGAYFFANRDGVKNRVVIKRAKLENGKLVLERVTPEGKKEMDYSVFIKNYSV
jgi:methionyl-tRNA formyltransferase